jgi:hypothetical protein
MTFGINPKMEGEPGRENCFAALGSKITQEKLPIP